MDDLTSALLGLIILVAFCGLLELIKDIKNERKRKKGNK